MNVTVGNPSFSGDFSGKDDLLKRRECGEAKSLPHKTITGDLYVKEKTDIVAMEDLKSIYADPALEVPLCGS